MQMGPYLLRARPESGVWPLRIPNRVLFHGATGNRDIGGKRLSPVIAFLYAMPRIRAHQREREPRPSSFLGDSAFPAGCLHPSHCHAQPDVARDTPDVPAYSQILLRQ